MTDGQLSSAQKSYDRTMGIIGEGLKACQDDLAQDRADREQYYLDLLSHPEWLETEAYEETVAETAAEETLSEAS